MPIQDTRQQQQNQQIVQSNQFNDLMFQSSVSQYLQQHQSAQGGTANVTQAPTFTTVISKSNSKPSLKGITSRGKHQANIVYTSKSMNNLYSTYSSAQQQSQQNLPGQGIERICKYISSYLYFAITSILD